MRLLLPLITYAMVKIVKTQCVQIAQIKEDLFCGYFHIGGFNNTENFKTYN